VTDLDNFFSQISEEKPIRLFLPILDADERLLIQCVLKKSQTNHFNLLFKPGTLPVNKIDQNTTCLINLDVGGQSVSLEGKIIRVVNDQTLEIVAQKTITHEQVREYFRVDCTVPIIVSSLIPLGFGDPEDSWEIRGTTVDLSGSGLRASFKNTPPPLTQVRLKMVLPLVEMTIVSTLASPVRISQLTETLWDVAYHFDQIEDEDRDKIIGCCLMAQRQLLRLKVQVKDS